MEPESKGTPEQSQEKLENVMCDCSEASDNHSAEEKHEMNMEAVRPQPGIALIKPQYIDTKHERKVAEEYLPKAVVEEFKQVMQTPPEGTAGDQQLVEKHAGADQPARKKLKLKGRNKKRPVEKKPQGEGKLCPNVVQEVDCPYGGDRCKYSHDVERYLAIRPADVGDRCHLYELLGKCPYGVTCCWSSHHLTEDHKNKINDELFQVMSQKTTVTNVLLKPVQQKLWKRKYDFSRADCCWKAAKQEVETGSRQQSTSCQDNKVPKISNAAEQSHVDISKQTKELDISAGAEKALGNADCDNECASSAADGDQGTISVTGNQSESGQIVRKSGSEENNDSVAIKDAEQPDGAGKVDKPMGPLLDDDHIKLRPAEKKKIDFADKLYMAPLTTVGNLPFRRIGKQFGADITCGEMAVATSLLQGHASEWALLKRHESEDLFGVQICGSFPDTMSRCAQLISENTDVDFVDINCGCPIDLVYKRGEGCALMGRTSRFEQIVSSMTTLLDQPLTVKIRTGIHEDKNIAHTLVPRLRDWGVSLVTVHGRSREQRYTRLADWDYINQCAELARPMPVFGNGDVLSYEDYNRHKENTGITGIMIARGALIKPWIFTEIKEQRHWDISANERLDMLRDFTHFGLEHWGSDQQGVGATRRFLLEWLSFLHRYIPVGLLEHLPQKINEKPPYYFGRNDLETLMASPNCGDWIKLSEMLLGPVPAGFSFLPKHKANAYK